MTLNGTTEYVFGKNPILMLLKHSADRVFKVLVAEELSHDKRLKEVVQAAKSCGITVNFVPKAKLDLLPDRETPHQGVAAMVSPKPLWDLNDLLSHLESLPQETPALVLALDDVTDPRNFGALIRVAAAAGVTAIIIPKVGSAGFSPAVGKASAGTIELINICVVPNLVDALKRTKNAGLWWVGAMLGEKAVRYDQYDFKGPTGIVLGSEGHGLRRLVQEHCDHWVTIPLAPNVESLNVSVAGGILIFEALRQRRQG